MYSEVEIHQKIYDKLDFFYKTNKIPHIIFHGPSGSGKRSIVNRFLNKIYENDSKRLKTNVMMVNCAHGKGIKFIREELKFFAKTNIQSNSGILFKTIVLLNADNLTIDAQSALRRCIELFSSNTRFFIIVENKNKLLNPILSRFCEIYVPEHIVDNKVVNLHQYNIKHVLDFSDIEIENKDYIHQRIFNIIINYANIPKLNLVHLATEFYEKGLSCLDVIRWIETTTNLTDLAKTDICMHFEKVKSEFRCEKLLMLYLFDLICNLK